MLALNRFIFPHLALAASIGLVLLGTLTPSGSETFGFARCVFCNPRALADGIGNVALFIPVGLSMCAAGFRIRTAIAAGVILTIAIEILQLFVPGRDPSASDIITNSAGAVAGAMAAGQWRFLKRPATESRRRLAWAAAALTCLVFVATAFMVSPSMPPTRYWGQWTPRLESLEPYLGTVETASVGGVEVPPTEIVDSRGLRERLESAQPIHVKVLAGPPPSRVSSIFSIADEESRRVLLVGASGADLVFRYRSRAADWRLDQPDMRAKDALLKVDQGQVIDIDIAKQEKGYCAAVAGTPSCSLGYGAGDGWALLMSSAAIPVRVREVLQGVWVGAFTLIVAFWCRDGIGLYGPLLLVAAALLAVPWVTPLLASRPQEWIGAILGSSVGAGLGRAWH